MSRVVGFAGSGLPRFIFFYLFLIVFISISPSNNLIFFLFSFVFQFHPSILGCLEIELCYFFYMELS